MRSALRNRFEYRSLQDGYRGGGRIGGKSQKIRQGARSRASAGYQGIYGFIIGIIASSSLGDIATVAQGWTLFGAVMPMAVSGLITGFFQGKSAVNCIYAVGKQDSLGGKLIIYPAMIEFYAILGLIISIMLVAV